MKSDEIRVEIPIDSTEVQLSNHCLGVKSRFAENNYDRDNFDSNGFFHPLRSFGIGRHFEVKDDRLLGAKRVVILRRKLDSFN